MPIQPTRDPQHLLEQLRNFPVDVYHRGTQRETAVLDACVLLDDAALRELATAEYPAALARACAMRLFEKSYRLREAYQDERREKLECLDKGRAYYTISLALRDAFPPAPEAVRCLDKLGPLEANALHILATREGSAPVAVRTEALAQLSKLELLRVDVNGRPFPLELTPLGLEVWALRQPGSPVNRYEVEKARIRKLVEDSGGRLVTTAEQRPRTATFYFEPLDRAPEVHEMRRDGDGDWYPKRSDEPLRQASRVVLDDGTVIKDRSGLPV